MAKLISPLNQAALRAEDFARAELGERKRRRTAAEDWDIS